MPTDIRFPFQYDETGDVSTVEGQAFYEQHATILGLVAVEERLGEPLTANDIIEIESRIERVYAQSPYFEEPSVTVTDVNARDESLDVTVDARNLTQFDIPLTDPDDEL